MLEVSMDPCVSVDRVIHRCETYTTEAFQRMAEFRKQNQFTDVVLVAGAKRIPAHKVIISSLCDYFQAMFTNDLQEMHQQVYRFVDFMLECLYNIIIVDKCIL